MAHLCFFLFFRHNSRMPFRADPLHELGQLVPQRFIACQVRGRTAFHERRSIHLPVRPQKLIRIVAEQRRQVVNVVGLDGAAQAIALPSFAANLKERNFQDLKQDAGVSGGQVMSFTSRAVEGSSGPRAAPATGPRERQPSRRSPPPAEPRGADPRSRLRLSRESVSGAACHGGPPLSFSFVLAAHQGRQAETMPERQADEASAPYPPSRPQIEERLSERCSTLVTTKKASSHRLNAAS
jgi:hypothetical protein